MGGKWGGEGICVDVYESYETRQAISGRRFVHLYTAIMCR